MINKLLGAAVLAAMTCAFLPAHAARVGVGCTGDNMAKAEGNIDYMADGPAKFTAQREIAAAQDAMLGGNMSRCAMHLGMAMRGTSAPYPGPIAQSPYGGYQPQTPYADTRAEVPYGNTQAEVPADTTYPSSSQPQWGWKPMQGPR